MRWFLIIFFWSCLIWLGFALRGNLSTSSAPTASAADSKYDFLGSPLSSVPFSNRLSHAMQSREDIASDERRRLAEHILELNPRDVTARAVIADIDFRDGKYEAAARSISLLITQQISRDPQLLDALERLALFEFTRPVIEELLAERPSWAPTLVTRLTTRLYRTDFILQAGVDYPETQEAIIRTMVRNGEMDRAYGAFQLFLDPEVRASQTVPFDGELMGLDGAPPFNWTLNSKFANFEPQGGLAVSLFDQGRQTLAEQTIRLEPGAYSATFQISGDLFNSGASFEWSLDCTDSDTTLMQIQVTELTSIDQSFEAQFDVPGENCAFQTLKFSGVTGDYLQTVRARVSEVRILPKSDESIER